MFWNSAAFPRGFAKIVNLSLVLRGESSLTVNVTEAFTQPSLLERAIPCPFSGWSTPSLIAPSTFSVYLGLTTTFVSTGFPLWSETSLRSKSTL